MSVNDRKIITIIQTRRGSSRLPDKVLLPLAGKPLFIRQAERVGAAVLAGQVVVATTTDPEDDLIEDICHSEDLACFRGDETDLLDRHYQAALYYGADIVIKIPSDCPLIDPAIIDGTISFYLEHDFDFVSNLHPPSWPDGNDVEVMSFGVLKEAWENATRPLEREHTTPYIWERPERFRIGNVTMEDGKDFSMTHRFTIDYSEDYEFIRTVFESLYPTDPLFRVGDILSMLERRPEVYAINSALAGVNWYRHHLDELRTVSADQTRMKI
jgi:spore coat polysaccharide biosynthesis protein SpsF